LKDFFETLYGEREPLENLAQKYFVGQRSYEEDVQSFLVSLKKRPPKTVSLKLTAVRMMLLENGVELENRFWRRIRNRIKGRRAVSVDKVPTPEEFRKILNHLPVHGRAFSLVLLSSGMRLGEALQLKIEDVDLEKNPVKVTVRAEYTKSGNKRFTFISREAQEVVLEWLKVRQSWLEAAVKKSTRYHKALEDDRLFPFTRGPFYSLWHNALDKAEYNERDEETQRRKIHPHVLRKSFRTKLGAVIPVDVVEALMGHEGYLTEVYRRYTIEDLAKFYKKGEPALLVFTESAEVNKLRKDMEEATKERRKQEDYFMGKIIELEQKMGRTRDELKAMRDRSEIREDSFNKFMEILARAKNVDEALEKFRRFGENPKPDESTIKIVQGEEALVAHLKQGWTLVKELNHDKYLLKSAS